MGDSTEPNQGSAAPNSGPGSQVPVIQPDNPAPNDPATGDKKPKPHPPLQPADLKNIQGDVIIGLPKKAQKFFFFKIANVAKFRERLGDVMPLITTCAQAHENRQAIRNRYRKQDNLHMGAVNIAFSWEGLKKIDPNLFTDGASGDPDLFEKGMKATRQSLRDDPENWNPANWKPFDQKQKTEGFEGGVDGVFLVVGEDYTRVEAEWSKIYGILDDSIDQAFVLNGHVRPGPEAGHEHFGFLDGVSQPFIIGTEKLLGQALPGQGEVKPGVILFGRDGDNVEVSLGGDASTADPQFRPSWQKDGSFLAFRYLRQKVPEFDDFLARSATDRVGKDLLGARMVGRWKSGAPLDIAPFQDDRSLAKDPTENNNFQFEDNDDDPTNPHARCPFSAHIRKTHPRKDLKAGPMSMERILRRGIPYGPETPAEEMESKVSAKDRGLLFVSYQSHLSRGFELMQKTWANNPGFIFGKKPEPGVDPIIGQSHADPTAVDQTGASAPKAAEARHATGLFSANVQATTNQNKGFRLGEANEEWVESRGGEYFFTPSISSLLQYIAI